MIRLATRAAKQDSSASAVDKLGKLEETGMESKCCCRYVAGCLGLSEASDVTDTQADEQPRKMAKRVKQA